MVGAIPALVFCWLKSRNKVVGLGLGVVALAAPWSWPRTNLMEEFDSIGDTDAGTAGTRRYFWDLSVKMFEERPMFGVGASCWGNALYSGLIEAPIAPRPHDPALRLLPGADRAGRGGDLLLDGPACPPRPWRSARCARIPPGRGRRKHPGRRPRSGGAAQAAGRTCSSCATSSRPWPSASSASWSAAPSSPCSTTPACPSSPPWPRRPARPGAPRRCWRRRYPAVRRRPRGRRATRCRDGRADAPAREVLT